MANPTSNSCLRCLGPEYSGPPEPTTEAMLAALRTVLQARSAVYVSSPITTGPRFLAWLRAHGVSAAYDLAEIKSAVVQHNLADAAAMIGHVRERFPDLPVIDPTALEDRPDWEQHHYHLFWLAVIREFARTLVVLDGWEFSTGCALEVAEAMASDIPLLDQRFQLIDRGQAAEVLVEAVKEYSRHDVPMRGLELAAHSVLQDEAGA